MHPFTQRLQAMNRGFDMFSNNPFERGVMWAGQMGAPLATAAVGVGDLAFGEQNALNSGELPVNGVVTHSVVPLGALAGAGIGITGAYLNSPREQGLLPSPSMTGPDPIDLVPTRSGKYEYRQPKGRRIVPTKGLVRGGLLGSSIGALTAAIPAIGFMANDQPSEAALVDSLSDKDKAVLNALLKNQGVSI